MSGLLSHNDKNTLRTVAAASIEYSLEHSQYTNYEDTISSSDYSTLLLNPGASFVTLKLDQELRGCIGSLEAEKELLVDVIQNARSAAFFDPRFAPVTPREFKHIDLYISVLSKPQSMSFTSEQDLLRQLRPGVDGLVLEAGYRRGTFLPVVWESLPDAKSFLQHLKQKAGLPLDYWSDDVKCARYTTDSF